MTDSKGRNLLGYILVVVSAVSFSAKGIFAKIIYGYGVDPITLLALRFAITMPLFWGTLFFYPSGKIGKRDAITLVVIGFTGFYTAAMLDFYGLIYIEATLERLIIYTYPAVVVLLAGAFLREKIDGKKVISVVLTYTGLLISLKVWEAITSTGVNMIGAGLVFSAAVFYSVSYILMEVIGRRVSGVKISAYATTLAGSAFIATWHFSYVPTEPAVWLQLALLAVVSTYLPILTLLLGIKRVGASKSAVISFIGPVSTAILAYITLGERLDAVQIAGMGVVIAGVLMISKEKPAKPRA